MTTSVINTLNKIKNNQLFEKECNLYFAGGTALSFYLEHRISEDIDIVSDKLLNYKSIIPNMQKLGAKQIQDENAMALRLEITNEQKNINTLDTLYDFINSKKEPQEDEAVYLNENNIINLTFLNIKNNV